MRLKNGFIVALSAGALFGGMTASGRERPNVVFILSDDHRYDLMSFMGNPYIKTPNIDRLAGDGIVFQNAFCASPLCTPSRASFWTGRYPEKTGAPCIVDEPAGFLELSRIFAEDLHDSGYTTAFIGKWHLGDGKNPKRGFDHWASWDWVGHDFNYTIQENGRPVQMTGFTDDNTSRMAAEYIQQHAADKQPFFLYLGLKAPHLPYAYPERLEHAFDGIDIPKPSTFDEDYAQTGKRGLENVCIRAADWVHGIPKFGNWENYVKSYYRAAQSIDESVGTVVQALEKAGIDDNTLVIYSSDHGYHIGDHGLTEKHFTYRNVLHIPMIMRLPGLIKKGTVSDELVSAIDVAPTVLDLCGVKAAESMDGKSLIPLLKNKGVDPAPRDNIFCAFDADTDRVILRGNACVRTKEHKLIWFSDIDHYELYDVHKDPDEMNNLIAQPEYAPVFKEMKARLKQKLQESSWGQLKKHPMTGTCYVLGPVAEKDEEAVRQELNVPGIDYSHSVKGYKWTPVKACGALMLGEEFGKAGDRGFIAFPVNNKKDSIGFLQIDVSKNGLPMMGVWGGDVVFGNKLAERLLGRKEGFHQRFFQYCPPIRPGHNDVVIEFAVQSGKAPVFETVLTFADSLLELPSMNFGEAAGPVPLRLGGEQHQLVRIGLPGGVMQIKTTGGDAYTWVQVPQKFDPQKLNRIEFEYQSCTGLDEIQIFFGPNVRKENSVVTGPIDVSNVWKKCRVDFSALPNYDRSVPFFRFDFGRRTGREIKVRNILLTGEGI
ncbi:sulfatase-like hydrolase/transferase [Tichowtungia aerotolerans]|uniref:Sulfatase-like hydrolase/transferase n=1 Tax=Tichowtungia aerotolerans TaxID=2697043 RepID=A0A6P1MB73_9BACT|nr:sulfatase-like hydrolase/transferase [Tichowtungia aerotolerans]QHI69794.1 sulfatase-like hydrolase/transferase [Tichowtungia aerotolerans]